MLPSSKKFNLKNPLQLLGIYLGWLETAAAVGLFAVNNVNSWPRDFVIFALGFGIISYVLIVGFVNIYLTIRSPHFLFNPSDYAKDVQPYLFDSPLDIKGEMIPKDKTSQGQSIFPKKDSSP
jgi:hypothetical protein